MKFSTWLLCDFGRRRHHLRPIVRRLQAETLRQERKSRGSRTARAFRVYAAAHVAHGQRSWSARKHRPDVPVIVI